MKPCLPRLLQAVQPIKPQRCQVRVKITELRPQRGTGLSNAEIILLQEDHIRKAFSEEKADVVEEIIEARREIWGGRNGGKMPDLHNTSSTLHSNFFVPAEVNNLKS